MKELQKEDECIYVLLSPCTFLRMVQFEWYIYTFVMYSAPISMEKYTFIICY